MGGYLLIKLSIGKAFLEKLKEQSIEIFTKVKKNMKKRILNVTQQFYLSKRGLIETVNDQLKIFVI